MARPKKQIDPSLVEKLKELYITQRMTVPMTAITLGITSYYARDKLKQLGLLHGYVPHNLKEDINDEGIRKMYLEESRSMAEMAIMFKCRAGLIRKRIVKNGWLKEPVKIVKKPWRKFLLSRDGVYREFITNAKSDEQIGREFGVSNLTVAGARKRYGIKRESPTHAKELPLDELKKLYLEDGLTLKQISDHFKCGKSTVRSHIIRAGFGLDAAQVSAYKRKRNKGKCAQSHTVSGGYKKILMYGHPSADGNGYIAEHRYIAEITVGRYLEFEEQVHHINTDKGDNAPSNLAIIKGREDHARVHKYMERGFAFLLGLTNKRPDPIKLTNPCFWAGKWVTEIDLLPA